MTALGTYAIRNGGLTSLGALSLGLDDTDITYGYGCYETLKVRSGKLYFPEFHEERFLSSAAILGIRHSLRPGELVGALGRLVEAAGQGDCNVKVMMIGRDGRDADWYAFLLPPVIPPADSYAEGVPCLLFRGERHFPAAKSLSMLLSTVAYRAAGRAGCYDALLVDGAGRITEGTRTNVFYSLAGEPEAVYTPPASRVLSGITRRTVMAALAEAGLRVEERDLPVEEAVDGRASLAVTSTSSKVIRVRRLLGEPSGVPGPRGEPLPRPTALAGFDPASAASVEAPPAPALGRVVEVYDAYLGRYAEDRSW